MDTLKNIQGVIFDYGGTIDTNSCHWAEVLWTKYMEHQVPVDKESFREAYGRRIGYSGSFWGLYRIDNPCT